MKRAIDESYGTKGENIVKMNYAAVDRGGEYVEVEIPKEWNNATGRFVHANYKRLAPEWIRNVADIVNSLRWKFSSCQRIRREMVDGTIPSGTAALKKRGIAVTVPEAAT